MGQRQCSLVQVFFHKLSPVLVRVRNKLESSTRKHFLRKRGSPYRKMRKLPSCERIMEWKAFPWKLLRQKPVWMPKRNLSVTEPKFPRRPIKNLFRNESPAVRVVATRKHLLNGFLHEKCPGARIQRELSTKWVLMGTINCQHHDNKARRRLGREKLRNFAIHYTK